MILICSIAAYAIVGITVAVAFFLFGVARNMPQASLTIGARVLLLPGAVALWPLVLHGWIRSRATR